MLAILVLGALFVAYANGANDNFKGVATLFGSGTTNYRRALAWATLTTLAGSLAALVLSGELVSRFSGKGLVPDALTGDPTFLTAVALATAGTVLLATRLSFPISTTHALTGALLGAGLVLGGGEIRFAVLGGAFVLPLLASPLLALVLSISVYGVAHRLRVMSGLRRESCVCVHEEWVPVAMASPSTVAEGSSRYRIETCQERYQGTILSLTAQGALDKAHYLSAGAVSFARGLNDTPKIVALLVASEALQVRGGMILIGLCMGLGAVLHARRVAETLSRRITKMNHGQGFTANLVTAALVLAASKIGVPVSTTHVSCGALFGIGAASGQARWKVVGAILLSWVITLPVAAFLAALAAWALPAA